MVLVHRENAKIAKAGWGKPGADRGLALMGSDQREFAQMSGLIDG